jgi:hypothetical protein
MTLIEFRDVFKYRNWLIDPSYDTVLAVLAFASVSVTLADGRVWLVTGGYPLTVFSQGKDDGLILTRDDWASLQIVNNALTTSHWDNVGRIGEEDLRYLDYGVADPRICVDIIGVNWQVLRQYFSQQGRQWPGGAVAPLLVTVRDYTNIHPLQADGRPNWAVVVAYLQWRGWLTCHDNHITFIHGLSPGPECHISIFSLYNTTTAEISRIRSRLLDMIQI